MALRLDELSLKLRLNLTPNQLPYVDYAKITVIAIIAQFVELFEYRLGDKIKFDESSL